MLIKGAKKNIEISDEALSLEAYTIDGISNIPNKNNKSFFFI